MALELNISAQDALVLMAPTRQAVIEIETNSMPGYDVDLFKTVNDTVELSTSDGNGTNRSGGIDHELQKLEIAVQALILYMALFGNGVVLLVLKLRRQKLSRMQWFIAHLAVTDIFVAISNTMTHLIEEITGDFRGNDFLCKLVKYSQVIAFFASSYVLVMTAIDRYLSICHPLTSQIMTPKRVHLMIALAWLLSLLFAIPQLFLFQLKLETEGNYSGWYLCQETMSETSLTAYVTWMFLSVYVIPSLLLAFCYGKICHVVWLSVGSKETASYSSVRQCGHHKSAKEFRMRVSFRPQRDGANGSLGPRDRLDQSSVDKKPRGHQRGVSKSKMKTVKLTLSVVLCYLFCLSPYYICNILTVYTTAVDFEHPVVVISMLLPSLNSCTNPWIYLAFSGRSCPWTRSNRKQSRSWAPSTNVTSGADSLESKTRSSFIDMAHTNSRHTSPRPDDKKLHHSKC